MIRSKVFLLFCFVKMLFAKVSFEDAIKVCKEKFPLLKEDNPCHPVWGYLFDAQAAYNYRFFHPDMKTVVEGQESTEMKRNYAGDKGLTVCTKAIRVLFPSTGSNLSYVTSISDSPGKVISMMLQKKDGDSRIGIKFMAHVFKNIQKSTVDTKNSEESNNPKKSKNSNESKNSEESNELITQFMGKSKEARKQPGVLSKEQEFGKVLKILIAFSNETKENPFIKLFIIHAFVINIIDDPEDLEYYLQELKMIPLLNPAESAYPIRNKETPSDSPNSIKTDVSIPNSTDKLHSSLPEFQKLPTSIQLNNFDLLGNTQKLIALEAIFPYSDNNPPPSNACVPIYVRKTNKFLLGVEHFPDCADITLMNLCNCLLWNDGKYKIKESIKENLPIREFYEKYSTKFVITIDVRNDWSKVIQDLENFSSNNYTDDKHYLNMLFYNRNGEYEGNSYRNEVYTGFINMTNMLIHIFGLDHSKLWGTLN